MLGSHTHFGAGTPLKKSIYIRTNTSMNAHKHKGFGVLTDQTVTTP